MCQIKQNLETSESSVCPGRPTGSSGPAGAEEDRAAASGWIGLAAHRHGLLQDERGTASQEFIDDLQQMTASLMVFFYFLEN